MALEESVLSYTAPSYQEWVLARDSDPETSTVNTILELEDITEEHEGWYRCMADNVQGEGSSWAFRQRIPVEICCSVAHMHISHMVV